MKIFLKGLLLFVVLIGTFIGLLFYNALVIDTCVGWFYEDISYKYAILFALLPTILLYRFSLKIRKKDNINFRYFVDLITYVIGSILGAIIVISFIWLTALIISLFI